MPPFPILGLWLLATASFVTSTGIGYTTKPWKYAPEISTVPIPLPTGNGISYASACNAAKQSWSSHGGLDLNHPFEYISTRAWPFYNTTTLRRTITDPVNASTYTLCDGYPRVNATTRTSRTLSSWIAGTTTSTAHGITYTYSPEPSCTIQRRDCAVLHSSWSSSHAVYTSYYSSLLASTTPSPLPQKVPNPGPSPACQPSNLTSTAAVLTGEAIVGAPLQQSAVKGLPQCLQNFASVRLLYWPVSVDPGDLCNSGRSTMTLGPTISGKPNTYKIWNTTLTSPTVYVQFDGTWVYESSGSTTSNQSRLLKAHSSTDISSICGTISGIGSPQSFNYGDFNWPVPASAYRCQPKCFEAPPNGVSFVDNATYWAHSDRTFVTLWTYFSSTPWAKENQCSTIYDDYKPILSIPPEFSAMTPAVDVGDGITCSFEFNSEAIFYDPPSALAPAASLALPSKPRTNAAQSTSISPITPTQGPEPSSVPTPLIPKPTQDTTTQELELGTDTIIDHSGSRLFQPSGSSESSQRQSGFSLKLQPANTDQKSYEEASALASSPALDPPAGVALTGNDDSPTASPDPSSTNTAIPSDPEAHITVESHVGDSTTDIPSGNANDDQSHGSISAMMTSSANVAAIIATILGAVRATASSTSTDPQRSEPVEASHSVSMGEPAATDRISSNDPDSLIVGNTETVDGHGSIDSSSMDSPSSAQHFSDTTLLVTQGTSAIAFGAPWSVSSSSNIAKETPRPIESENIVSLAPSGSLPDDNRSKYIPSMTHTTPRAVISWDGKLHTANPAHEFSLEPGITLQPGKPMTISGSAVSFDQSASVLVINGVTQSLQLPRTSSRDRDEEHTLQDTAATTTSPVSSQDQRVPGASTSDSASQKSSTETAASTESMAGRSLSFVHAVIISLSFAVLALL